MLVTYNPMSTIDDPRGVAIVLYEHNCNLRCPYCHNTDLINETVSLPKKEEISALLKKRAGIIEYVAISGGEPTACRPDVLINTLEEIFELGYKIKLDTNGVNHANLKKILDSGYVSYVAMDIKTSFNNYGPLSNKGLVRECNSDALRRSFSLLVESLDTCLIDGYELRTTCVAPFISPPYVNELILDLKRLLGYRKVPVWYLQKAILTENVMDPSYPMSVIHRDEMKMYKEIIEMAGVASSVILR